MVTAMLPGPGLFAAACAAIAAICLVRRHQAGKERAPVNPTGQDTGVFAGTGRDGRI